MDSNNFHQNDPMFRLMCFIETLLNLCIVIAFVSVLCLVFIPMPLLMKGELIGILTMAVAVFFSFVWFAMSFISKDDIDEIKKEIERELEEEKKGK